MRCRLLIQPRVTVVPLPGVVRLAPRQRLDVPVDLLCNEQLLAAVAGNVSEGGLFVVTRSLPVGTLVHVRFALPDDARPIMMVAEVRWAATDGLGLRFVRVKPRDLERIRRFVSEHGETEPVAVH